MLRRACLGKWLRALGLGSALGLGVLGTGGCLWVPANEGVVVEGYVPLRYNGYAVSYDENGLPIYYVDGIVYYVPTSYAHYPWLLGHYRSNAMVHHGWGLHRGHSAPAPHHAPARPHHAPR